MAQAASPVWGMDIPDAEPVFQSTGRRMPRQRNQRLREAREETYRALIRESAERGFAEHGFAGARVEDISRDAGVSLWTIYRAFPGKKRELYRAIQEQRGTELLGTTQAAGTAAWQERGDLIDAMLVGLAALVDYFTAHPDYLRLVL